MKQKTSVGFIIGTILVSIFALLCILPLIYMVAVSFTDSESLYIRLQDLRFNFSNFEYALTKRGQMPESELPCETDYDTGEDEDNPAVKIANPKDEAFKIDEEENEDERDLKKFIDTVFNVLDERESDMINMYYGRLGYKEYTLEQIGKNIN